MAREAAELPVLVAAESQARQAVAELEFLHGAVLRLNAAGPEEDVFQILAEEVGRLDPDALVFASSFHAERRTVTVRAVVGTPGKLATLREALPGDVVGLELPVPVGSLAELEDGRVLRLVGGLSELTLDVFPAAACREMEERLGIGGIHAIALTYGEEPLGTLAVVTRTPEPPARAPLIETLVRQGTLAIRQRVAMAAAQEAERGLRDLTATLERRVAERTRRLRELAAQLVQTEQRERTRLARALHDDLQQLLVAARNRAALALRETDEPARVRQLAEVEALLGECIRASRTVTIELSPPALREQGLLPALRWLARWVQEKHGIAVRLTLDPSGEPGDEAVRLALFAACRELLLNVVKHAGVTGADIAVAREEDSVRLTVADAGVGFAPDGRRGPEDPSGFGLFGVGDRLQLLGGTMAIDSRPGAGTRIVLTVPTGSAPPPTARSETN